MLVTDLHRLKLAQVYREAENEDAVTSLRHGGRGTWSRPPHRWTGLRPKPDRIAKWIGQSRLGPQPGRQAVKRPIAAHRDVRSSHPREVE